MCEDGDVQHVLTHDAFDGLARSLGSPARPPVAVFSLNAGLADALANRPATPPPRKHSLRSLAYIIFTSGSTGRPKVCREGGEQQLCVCMWVGSQKLFQVAHAHDLHASLTLY
jgi:non-ribosomal peptide synthetase component F